MPAYRQLQLTTFNCKNIQTNGVIFSELAKTEDIILVQEHWLSKCQLNLLDEINEQFMTSGKSVDHYNPKSPAQIPRGYGGVAIIWNKNIDHIVNDLDIGRERINCIEFLLQRPMLIVSVYMPCNGEKDNYYSFMECVEQLQEIIYKYRDSHDIIIGGDFNENATQQLGTKRSKCLHKFLSDNNLVTRKTENTFIHSNGRDTSLIDFIVYQETFESKIQIKRADHYISNVFDHYPVQVQLKTEFCKLQKQKTKDTSSAIVTRINRKRLDKDQYREKVIVKLADFNVQHEELDID